MFGGSTSDAGRRIERSRRRDPDAGDRSRAATGRLVPDPPEHPDRGRRARRCGPCFDRVPAVGPASRPARAVDDRGSSRLAPRSSASTGADGCPTRRPCVHGVMIGPGPPAATRPCRSALDGRAPPDATIGPTDGRRPMPPARRRPFRTQRRASLRAAPGSRRSRRWQCASASTASGGSAASRSRRSSSGPRTSRSSRSTTSSTPR